MSNSWQSSYVINPNIVGTGTFIATSDTGQYVYITVPPIGSSNNSGSVYVNNNYGAINNWVQCLYLTNYPWSYGSIATSGSGEIVYVIGTYLVQSTFTTYSYIYASTNYGSTWTQLSFPNTICTYISTSNDGQTLYVIYGDIINNLSGIYISTDGGSTWNLISGSTTTKFWSSISVTNKGNFAFAIANPGTIGSTLGYIYGFKNGVEQTTPIYSSDDYIYALAINSDASYIYILTATVDTPTVFNLYVGFGDANTYTYTFTLTSASNVEYSGITSSSSGKYIYISSAIIENVGGGYIYSSNNYGQNLSISNYNIQNWGSIVTSSSGTEYIYAYAVLTVNLSNSNIVYNYAPLPPTSYICSSGDLSTVLYALSSASTPANLTNYLINNGNYVSNTDLSQIFQPQQAELTLYNKTNFLVNNYTPSWQGAITGTYDLGQVFVNISTGFYTTGNPSITTDSTGLVTITYNNSGTLTFLKSFDQISYIVVSGGGGGGGGGAGTPGIVGTDGGGGGGSAESYGTFNSSNFLSPDTLTITIGGGGSGGSSGSTTGGNGGNGGISSIINSSSQLSISADAGLGAAGKVGGTGGSSGTGDNYYIGNNGSNGSTSTRGIGGLSGYNSEGHGTGSIGNGGNGGIGSDGQGSSPSSGKSGYTGIVIIQFTT